mmetsp:Transcript_22578/g.33045  ORF Transcript_22578/g.33045 Transcript_22578/m.33045 type:complete len:414 (-) Transcript_22578:87-1328(-)|eukprot:CAMPEP_0197257182 /NCGR_PEP_ID=MMETSP1429-20130617/77906_1 /TAXON_ID=49237 /ORGANISM="Chaetoceros  sp., Strain UNC1202" /LENGTH=413 /DNA_ID=CAMNT_0042720965 /DNA_START=67 /DNA_END=1308 /DNA_ORIENTATION=-
MSCFHDHRNSQRDQRLLLVLLGYLSLFTVLQIFTLEYFQTTDHATVGDNIHNLLSPGKKVHSINALRTTRHGIFKHKDDGGEKEAMVPTGGKSDTEVKGETSVRPLEEILASAGVEVTQEIQDSLPPVQDIVDMYGDRPVIAGLDRCDAFQDSIKFGEGFIAPAGMFNTGTNLLAEMLEHNCYLPDKVAKYGEGRVGIRYQVPWGKHSPVSWRFKHHAPQQEDQDQSSYLAAVVIKDPYTWMDSMCRHKYAANWMHFEGHCPNLVPITPKEKKIIDDAETVEVKIRYFKHNVTSHTSMAGLWNDWYGSYLDADFPRLVVRFEDLLLHAEDVVGKVCRCGGGKMYNKPFEYIQDSAKKKGGKVHEGSNGLVKSMIKYGDAANRLKPYQPEDLEYAKLTLREDLMDQFHYSRPSS